MAAILLAASKAAQAGLLRPLITLIGEMSGFPAAKRAITPAEGGLFL